MTALAAAALAGAPVFNMDITTRSYLELDASLNAVYTQLSCGVATRAACIVHSEGR